LGRGGGEAWLPNKIQGTVLWEKKVSRPEKGRPEFLGEGKQGGVLFSGDINYRYEGGGGKGGQQTGGEGTRSAQKENSHV